MSYWVMVFAFVKLIYSADGNCRSSLEKQKIYYVLVQWFCCRKRVIASVLWVVYAHAASRYWLIAVIYFWISFCCRTVNASCYHVASGFCQAFRAGYSFPHIWQFIITIYWYSNTQQWFDKVLWMALNPCVCYVSRGLGWLRRIIISLPCAVCKKIMNHDANPKKHPLSDLSAGGWCAESSDSYFLSIRGHSLQTISIYWNVL